MSRDENLKWLNLQDGLTGNGWGNEPVVSTLLVAFP